VHRVSSQATRTPETRGGHATGSRQHGRGDRHDANGAAASSAWPDGRARSWSWLVPLRCFTDQLASRLSSTSPLLSPPNVWNGSSMRFDLTVLCTQPLESSMESESPDGGSRAGPVPGFTQEPFRTEQRGNASRRDSAPQAKIEPRGAGPAPLVTSVGSPRPTGQARTPDTWTSPSVAGWTPGDTLRRWVILFRRRDLLPPPPRACGDLRQRHGLVRGPEGRTWPPP